MLSVTIGSGTSGTARFCPTIFDQRGTIERPWPKLRWVGLVERFRTAVADVGLIDRSGQAKIRGAQRSDTPTHFAGCAGKRLSARLDSCDASAMFKEVPVSALFLHVGHIPHPTLDDAASEQLLQSVIDLQERIRQTGTLSGKEFSQRTQSEAPRPLALELPPSELVVAPGDFATATRWKGDGPQ